LASKPPEEVLSKNTMEEAVSDTPPTVTGTEVIPKPLATVKLGGVGDAGRSNSNSSGPEVGTKSKWTIGTACAGNAPINAKMVAANAVLRNVENIVSP